MTLMAGLEDAAPATRASRYCGSRRVTASPRRSRCTRRRGWERLFVTPEGAALPATGSASARSSAESVRDDHGSSNCRQSAFPAPGEVPTGDVVQRGASTCPKESTTRSASPKAGWPPSPGSGTAMHAIDAAFAATTPAGASSHTRQRFGGAPSFDAAVRNTAGWGLPYSSSSAECTSAKRSRRAEVLERGVDQAVLRRRRHRQRPVRERRTGRSHATAPGLSEPLVRIRSITRSTIETATSAGDGPGHG